MDRDDMRQDGEGPVSSADLGVMRCPRCGREMEHGYLAGHWARLRWTAAEKTYTILAGTTLRRQISWWSAPTLEAMRCEDCKIGLFRYDY